MPLDWLIDELYLHVYIYTTNNNNKESIGQSEVSNTNKINKQSTRNSIPRGLEIILCKSYFVINCQEDQYKYDLISTKIPLHPLDGILLIWKGQDQHQLSAINTISNNRRHMNCHILPPSMHLLSPTYALHATVFFELHKVSPCGKSSTQHFQNECFDIYTFFYN